MKYTMFGDMYSGGSKKTDHEYIVIAAPREEAEVILEDKFGVDPYGCACECCGNDFHIQEYDSFDEVLDYHRGQENFDKNVSKGLIAVL